MAHFWLTLTCCFSLLSCTDPTRVDIQLRGHEGIDLTKLELAARDKISLVDFSERVQIDVPAAWTEELVKIRITGLQATQRRAGAVVEVTPLAGQTVPVLATLTQLPCGVWCTPGETQCVAGEATQVPGVITCTLDGNGCAIWSPPASCSNCSKGRCEEVCTDECVQGERRCEGPTANRDCGQHDDDACLDWGPAQTCRDGTCAHGICQPTCVNECRPGETVCSGNGVRTCGDLNLDGCQEWGPAVACADGSCRAGQCVNGPPTPTPRVCVGSCDDGDPCTTDGCDAIQGCVHTKVDADGDGFGPGRCGGDCNDNNRLVFPGQTAWFTQPVPGTSSYDYDCDGRNDGESIELGACADAPIASLCRLAATGWLTLPACGALGQWVAGCYWENYACHDNYTSRRLACH